MRSSRTGAGRNGGVRGGRPPVPEGGAGRYELSVPGTGAGGGGAGLNGAGATDGAGAAGGGTTRGAAGTGTGAGHGAGTTGATTTGRQQQRWNSRRRGPQRQQHGRPHATGAG